MQPNLQDTIEILEQLANVFEPGITRDECAKKCENALKVLSCHNGPVELDEFKISQEIRRRLSRQHRLADAEKFTDLHRRLQSYSHLNSHQRSALLQCLLDLNQSKSSVKFSSFDSANFFQNANPGSLAPKMIPEGAQYHHQHQSSSQYARSSTTTTIRSSVAQFFPSTSNSNSIDKPPPTFCVNPLVSTTAGTPPLNARSSNSFRTFEERLTPKLRQKYDRPREKTEIEKKIATHPAATRIPENELCRDLIYVLQGIDGTHIRYSSMRNGEFSIDKSIPIPQKELILKLAEIGWMFLKIKNYVDAGSGLNNCAKGLIVQSLCAALQEELSVYYKLLATLQAQLNLELNPSADVDSLSLRRFFVWTAPIREKLKILASICTTCEDLRGIALFTALFQYSRHGDPEIGDCFQRLLKAICRPLAVFLMRWIFDGFLDDPYDEFFIVCDSGIRDEDLWTQKYSINESLVPGCFKKDMADKILLAGKSINFYRLVCKERKPVSGLEAKRREYEALDLICFFDVDRQREFESLFVAVYEEIGQVLLENFESKYKLRWHLKALQRFLLLAQGDFGRTLMESLQSDLDLPANEVHLYTLAASLETAVRSTCSAAEAEELLKFLDIRRPTEIPSASERGWNIFQLEYRVKGPIVTILNDSIMDSYSNLFSFIWRLKHLDMAITDAWTMQMTWSRVVKIYMPKMHRLLHQAHVLLNEMQHVIEQVEYYFYETAAIAWSKLEHRLNDETKDLDGVIGAYGNYVKSVLRRALLDEELKTAQILLRSSLDLINQFLIDHRNLFELLAQECERRKASINLTLQKTELKAKKEFDEKMFATYQPKLELFSNEFRAALQKFLLNVTEFDDAHLRWLCFRLDYSQFYRQFEPRLDTSITFARLSIYFKGPLPPGIKSK